MRAVAPVHSAYRLGATLAGRLSKNMRVRLTLWYLAILALVFLVFSGILITVISQNESLNQRTELINIAQRLAGAYNPADGQIDPASAPTKSLPATPGALNAPKAPQAQASLISAQVIAMLVNPQGAVVQVLGPLAPAGESALQTFLLTGALRHDNLAPAGSLAQSASAFSSLQLPVANDAGSVKPLPYVVYRTVVTSQGRVVGALAVATPDALNQAAQTVVPALLLAGPVTLLVAAIGGYWLASRALRPVRLITRAAQEISEGDLSRRLDLKRRDELGELAATFDRMLARLDAAFTRQRQFTADASHELRTPLTIVNLEVTRALATPRSIDEYVRALSAIQAENLAMTRLVNDLLTLARADAGSTSARFTPLDLSDVALEALERLEPLAQQRGVRLVVGALPELPILGERNALSQALTNLLENGVKYTAGVGKQVSLTTCRAERDGRAWAVARVVDDGPGIAAEHLPYLFERFYRVDEARGDGGPDDAGGSGLGLAIAQWAARSHGGELRVESAPGAGATFELWLPVSSSDVSNATPSG